VSNKANEQSGGLLGRKYFPLLKSVSDLTFSEKQYISIASIYGSDASEHTICSCKLMQNVEQKKQW
jgi:hypothetical protein